MTLSPKVILRSRKRKCLIAFQNIHVLVSTMYSTMNVVLLQLGPKKNVPLSLIEEKWADLALPKEQFDDLVRIGSFGGEVEWNKFFALACSAVAEVSACIACLLVFAAFFKLYFICFSFQTPFRIGVILLFNLPSSCS